VVHQALQEVHLREGEAVVAQEVQEEVVDVDKY
jgi:predicted DNA-binding antitoxin AbrB/MazE fold protein